MISNNSLVEKSEESRSNNNDDNLSNILRILTMLEKALGRLMRLNYYNPSQYPQIMLQVEEALNQLRSWVHDYKNFADLPGYNLTLGPAIKDLGDLIKELIAGCQPSAGKKQITLPDGQGFAIRSIQCWSI